MKLKNYTKFIGYFLIVGYIALLFVPSRNIKNVKRQPTSNVKKEPTSNVESNTNEGGNNSCYIVVQGYTILYKITWY